MHKVIKNEGIMCRSFVEHSACGVMVDFVLCTHCERSGNSAGVTHEGSMNAAIIIVINHACALSAIMCQNDYKTFVSK